MNTSKIDKLQEKADRLEFAIDTNKNDLSYLELQIDNFEPDLHDQYDDMLDEIYKEQIDQVNFISLPCASELLKEHDPVAYRCGYNDFVDSFDFESLEEYADLIEQLEEIEDTISSLEDELEEIQEEIEQLEDEE